MTINLSHEPEQTSYEKINKSKFTDWSLVISSAILLISLSIFGGLKYMNRQNDARKAQIENDINLATKSLEGNEVDEVADFMQRLSIVGSGIAARQNPNELIQELGKSMVTGSFVKSVQSGEATTTVTYVTDNYLVAAKQILSLKKSAYFSGVSLGKIYRGEDGKVLIDMELDV